MQFTELNAAFVELRNSLGSFVGENALHEINIKPPADNHGEVSFLRLVSWSYVLLYESGRVSIPFLLKLPSKDGSPMQALTGTRELVNLLRSWSSHNMGLSNKRDTANLRRVYIWLVQQGGIPQLSNDELWQDCFDGLCGEVGAIIAHCQASVTWALETPDDGATIIADLRRRVDRNWPGYKFDQLVEDASVRMGQHVDAIKFRNPRLGKWREFLETVSDDDDPERRIIAMIEKDLLDHTDETLPINGMDVMYVLQIDSGPEVGEVLRRARAHFRSGIRDRDQLLARLIKERRVGSDHQQLLTVGRR